jgi:hypothetical protein
MPARTRKIRHDENTRDKIQASQIINRLTAHILGKVDMPTSAVTAALGLLRKKLPDLANIEHKGDTGPVTYNIITGVPRKGDASLPPWTT